MRALYWSTVPNKLSRTPPHMQHLTITKEVGGAWRGRVWRTATSGSRIGRWGAFPRRSSAKVSPLLRRHLAATPALGLYHLNGASQSVLARYARRELGGARAEARITDERS